MTSDPAQRIAELEAQLAALTTNGAGASDPRAKTIAAFAHLTELPPIGQVIQRGRDPETARFTIVFADGHEVRVGTIKVLWSRAEFSKVLLVARGLIPAPCKPTEWTDAIGALFKDVVEVTETPDDSFQETVRDWLGTYARRAGRDLDGAADAREPFVKTTDDIEEIYVTANGLAKYVRREYSEQVKLPELRQALADLGFKVTKVSYNRGRDETRSSASYYHGPRTLLSSAEQPDTAL